MQLYLKLTTTSDYLFSDEGLSYELVEQQFAKFVLEDEFEKPEDMDPGEKFIVETEPVSVDSEDVAF